METVEHRQARLVPQRVDDVEACCSPRLYRDCRRRRGRNEREHRDERHRIGGADTEEQRRQQSCGSNGTHQPNGHADEHDLHSFTKQESKHIRAACAERSADAHLVASLGDQLTHHCIEPEHRQADCHRREYTEQRRVESRTRH